MEIKKIKMSPKKGGNGFISSYSINIGSNEAKECGLIEAGRQKVIVKIIDPDNRQIVIKEKQFTLTDEILQTVMEYSVRSNALSDQMTRSLPGAEIGDGYIAVELFTIPIPGLDVDNPYANELCALDKEFYEYLLSIPYESLTDLLTLMYMGRDQDADMTLPSTQRFGDYWAYLEMAGCFRDGPEAIACQVMDKSPLVQYLQNGRRIFLEAVRTEPVVEGAESEDNWNGAWS